ncbi:MAG: pentapeptide repeat-containing protein [Alphaproteobacteria bacterium]|nr:pentapeptide repeat-containing protein [Alphaproteobacteria bacterium]
MPNIEALEALKSGRAEWEKFRARVFKGPNDSLLTDGRIDLRSANLSYMDLKGYDLSRVDFSNMPANRKIKPANAEVGINSLLKTIGYETSGEGKNIEAAVLERTDLSFANLSGAYLFGSRFSGTRLTGTDMSGANIEGTEFIGAVLDSQSNLRRVKADKETLFRNCRIEGVDFSEADLSGVKIEESLLDDADLSGVRFARAKIKGTSWRGVRINEHTDFELADFPEHEAGLDQSEHMVLPQGINWTHVRWIGDKTLVAIAALGLVLCFTVLSAVRAASIGLAQDSAFGLVSPASIHTLMIGFAFILSGAITFRKFCPEEVKSFTVAQWVHLAGLPRPVYLARALKSRSAAAASLITVLIGFLILAFSMKAILLGIACPACFGGQ